MVVEEGLPAGVAANAAGVLAFTLGREVDFAVGPSVLDGSGLRHVGITRLPIPVLCADGETLKRLRSEAAESELLAVDFTDAAKASRTYEEYERKLAGKGTLELEYLGLALYGERKTVEKLTGSLPLLK
jgi:hypothetical protein